jgi:hypothetical protein
MDQKPLLTLRRGAVRAGIGAVLALSACTAEPSGADSTPACQQAKEAASTATRAPCLDRYDSATLALSPVAYFRLIPSKGRVERNAAGRSPDGAFTRADPGRAHRALPNGSPATLFDGRVVLRVPSTPSLSVPTTGALTLQAWVRPETLTFQRTQGAGYVTWPGKVGPDANEYAMRMYSLGNAEGRGNRVSAYAFNAEGGKGSGSYFQDPLTAGEWLMVTAVITTRADAGYPANTVTIYRGASRRQTSSLTEFDVMPTAGKAPLQVGGDAGSFFEGAIGKVAVFDRPLTPRDIETQIRAMTEPP